jgi:GNAT superfamily N-acetyltransferase
MTEPRIVTVDLRDPAHAAALVELLDHYARDPMGGAAPLEESVKSELAARLRALPSYVGFLALSNEEPVGLLNAFIGFSTFAARPLLNVHDLVVRESHRRRGIGRLLLERAELEAVARGCCKLTLEVLSENQTARAAYAAVGFRPSSLGEGTGHALFLEKRLKPPGS